jgi:hypothetical protein
MTSEFGPFPSFGEVVQAIEVSTLLIHMSSTYSAMTN